MLSRLAWLLDVVNIRNLCFLYFAVAPFLLDRKSTPLLIFLFAVGYGLSGMILVLALAERLTKISGSVRYNTFSIPVFVVLAVLFLTSLIANPSGLSSVSLWYFKFGKVLLPALVFFVMVNVMGPRDLPRLYGILLVLGVISALLGLVDIARALTFGRSDLLRVGDTMFGDPNKYAVFLNILYAMLLAGLLSRLMSKRPYAFFAMGSAALIVALFLTQSRSGIVAFALITIVCLWASRSRRVIFRAMIAFIPVSLLFAVAIFLRYTSDQSATTSDLARVWTYIVAWNTIVDNTLFGIGFGNTPEMYERYGQIYERLIGNPLDIHNAMLESFAQQGVFGFIAYLLFSFVPIIVLVRRISRNRTGTYPSVEIAALSIPLCFFVYGLFYHQYVTNEHFWTLMAFTMIVLKSGGAVSGELTSKLPRWI